MSLPGGDYWTRSHHPWSCVLFVLPLLIVYEAGMSSFSPAPTGALRNGADIWLRTGLSSIGIAPTYGAPVALSLLLLAWTLLYREQPPRDPVSVWIGMTVESAVLALVLYAAGRGFWPWLHSLSGLFESSGATMPPLEAGSALPQAAPPSAPEPAMVNLIRYAGAGIYEEALFRLLLFSGLLAAFNLAELPRRWGICLA